MRKILIAGEGIAGAALAYALEQHGVRATIVERAPRFEARGHMISLKGNGVAVLHRMGLYEVCQARAHTVETMTMFNGGGRMLRTAPGEAASAALGAYLMINRGELHAALHFAAEGRAELRHGTTIAALEQTPDGVRAVLSDGSEDRYDLVVGADGVHSHTRDLAFGAGQETPFGVAYLALTVRYPHGLPVRDIRAYMGRGRSMVVIPRDAESAFGTVYHPADDPMPRGGHEVLRPWLLHRYADFAPEARALFAAIGPDSWLFQDAVAMVRLPSPVAGRVVLVGDAGFCPTFMSGMGASLALQSSYLLARSLVEETDIDAALRRYAARVQPIATRYQQGAKAMRGALMSKSWLGEQVRDLGISLLPETVWLKRAAKFYDAEGAMAWG